MRFLKAIMKYAARLIESCCTDEFEIDSHNWASKMEIIGQIAGRHA